MYKLLQINVVTNWGSTGRITEEIGQVAIANGWNSYIAFGRKERESKSNKIKIGNKLDFISHIFLTRLFDIHGLASKRTTKKLIEQIEEIKPDIIHLHNIHGYYLNYEILFEYLKIINVPIVWTLHDCWAFTGHCTYFSLINCKKWQTECNHCPQKNMYPQSIWKDRSRLNFLDKKKSFSSCKDLITLIPVSNWLSNFIFKSFFDCTRVRRIYNGIDVNVFKPIDEEGKKHIEEKYGTSAKFLILGLATKWTTRKGLNDFIQLSKFLSNDSVILLVGLSEKQINTLPNTIIGIRRTENLNELAAIYSTADVLVNPTWEDNFPTTNLEALACGTPVITYQTGGSVEAVSSDTGFIVEQGNVGGIVKAIEIIKTNGKAKYSDNCRKRAIANFNKEDRYNEYIELYNSLLK